jgi:hypothetical protein
VLVFSLLFIVQFCFVLFYFAGSQSAQGYAGLYQGWLGKYRIMLDAHLFGLQNVSQAGLEPAADVAVAHLISQYNLAWKRFQRLVVQVFKVLILLSALFLHLWLQCLNKVFDSRNSCGLLLYPICHLRSSSQWLFNFHSLGN